MSQPLRNETERPLTRDEERELREYLLKVLAIESERLFRPLPIERWLKERGPTAASSG